MDEMPSIISQMADTYNAATESADRFSIALNVQVGMVNTITAELKKQVQVQNEAILKTKAQARAELIKAKIQQRANRESGKSTKVGGGRMGNTTARNDRLAVSRAQKAFDEVKDSVIDVQATKEAL